MSRYSLETVTHDTGITVVDVSNRMVDFGIDAPWLAHEPWFIPEPFTPEPGELWSKEDIDEWIDVLAHVIDEAYTNPEIVRTAPHNQALHQGDGSRVNEPEAGATTWRAHRRKVTAGAGGTRSASAGRSSSRAPAGAWPCMSPTPRGWPRRRTSSRPAARCSDSTST